MGDVWYIQLAVRKKLGNPSVFFNYLAEHEEFLPTVAKVWETTEDLYHSRSALSLLHKKLKQLKFEMRALNKTHYGDLPNRTKQAYEVLCCCQNQVLQDPNPITFAAAAAASDRWNHLARIEGKFYRQKSCIQWLKAGDQNTTFFHQSVQSRAAKNAIRLLVIEDGTILTTSADIKKEAVMHFQKFLQCQDQENEDISISSLQNLLIYRCFLEDA